MADEQPTEKESQQILRTALEETGGDLGAAIRRSLVTEAEAEQAIRSGMFTNAATGEPLTSADINTAALEEYKRISAEYAAARPPVETPTPEPVSRELPPELGAYVRRDDILEATPEGIIEARTVERGVDIIGALRAGVSPNTLYKAGYTTADVIEAQRRADALDRIAAAGPNIEINGEWNLAEAVRPGTRVTGLDLLEAGFTPEQVRKAYADAEKYITREPGEAPETPYITPERLPTPTAAGVTAAAVPGALFIPGAGAVAVAGGAAVAGPPGWLVAALIATGLGAAAAYSLASKPNPTEAERAILQKAIAEFPPELQQRYTGGLPVAPAPPPTVGMPYQPVIGAYSGGLEYDRPTAEELSTGGLPVAPPLDIFTPATAGAIETLPPIEGAPPRDVPVEDTPRETYQTDELLRRALDQIAADQSAAAAGFRRALEDEAFRQALLEEARRIVVATPPGARITPEQISAFTGEAYQRYIAGGGETEALFPAPDLEIGFSPDTSQGIAPLTETEPATITEAILAESTATETQAEQQTITEAILSEATETEAATQAQAERALEADITATRTPSRPGRVSRKGRPAGKPGRLPGIGAPPAGKRKAPALYNAVVAHKQGALYRIVNKQTGAVAYSKTRPPGVPATKGKGSGQRSFTVLKKGKKKTGALDVPMGVISTRYNGGVKYKRRRTR